MKEMNKAVKILRSGDCVGIPTETVYGLAADATNPKAIKKIFKLKGRPQNHPLILHISSLDQLKDWVEFIPDNAKKLMKTFWPGPMTLIFPLKKSLCKGGILSRAAKIITGNQKTIGIRMPSHPVTKKLLKNFGGPVVAPSANKFGHVSPTCADHVKSEFGNKLKLILDGGSTKLGIESTIINITENPSRLLRPGPLSIAKIKKLSGVKIISGKSKKSPRVSGNLKSHYAPRTPVKLFTGKLKSREKNTVVMEMPPDPVKYAKILYSRLRELDKQKFTTIYIKLPPAKPEWVAIRDRLLRAAG